MTPSIRPARLDDVPALVQLRMANAERHAALNPSHYRFPEPPAVQRYFEDRLSNPLADTGVLLVAEDAGTVAGMTELVLLSAPPDHQILLPLRRAEIHTVVLDAYRGKGIGKALIAAAEQHAIEHGVTLLFAPILAANSEAVGFYSGSGYAEYGLILTKNLPAG